MTDLHGSRDDLFDQIHSVVVAQSNGELTHERFAHFDRLLADSKTARQLYVEYIYESLALPLMLAMGEEEQVLPSFANIEQDISEPQILPSVTAAIPNQSPESRRDNSNPPPLFPVFISTTYHGTMGFLSQELPFSLFIATVMTGLGLWVASLIYVSRPEQMTQSGSRLPLAQPAFDPTLEVVGKITSMVDCRWSKDGRAPSGYDNILVGRQFKLNSGLMEITYRNGAKVILQGPVTYAVDSRDGGFLSAGKLTARLEKRGGVGNVEVASGQWPVVSEDNPKSAFPLSLSTFVVRTPTATITDLGTEFGVAVAEHGDLRVHVFAGVVDFQCISQDGQSHEGHRLVAGNSAQIKSGKITVSRKASPATDFVRVVRNPASTPATPIPGTLAYWRFEDNVPALDVSKQSKTQINVVHDSSGCQNHLDYYGSWGDDGIGNYVASHFVPPSSMFRPGYSGGSKSFNSAALAPNKCGVLFSDSLRHGSPFDFNGPFTLEGFYRTDGDQSRAGPMGIVFKGEGSPAYMVSLNRSSLGSAELTLFDAKGKTFAATVADRNYADGQWHYFAARYQVNQEKNGGTVSMLVANENGTVVSSVTATPPEFVLNWPNANLFIGRISHWPLNSVSGHFRGLIDEIRICRGALADTDLLFPLQQQKSVSVGGKEIK